MVAHAAFTAPEAQPLSIKLLDLLTNRYHLGLLRESSPAALHVELPASSRFHAGQRVRFIIADNQSLIARSNMHSAFITNVSANTLQLAVVPETAVA